MKTIVTTEIVGDQWVAKTPHQPELEGKGASEAEAINQLVTAVRTWRGEWAAKPAPPRSKALIIRHLSGCWPQDTTEPTQPTTPAKETPEKRKDL